MNKLLSLVLSSLVLVGCGGGGGFTPSAELQALADCTGLTLEDFGEIYGEILDLMDSLGGVLPPNATYDISDGDYTIALSIGTIAGVISSPNNLIDGLGVGETATATWELNGGLAGTSVTGEGTLTVSRPSASVFNTSGSGAVVDGSCQFSFSSLNFSTNTSTGGPVGTIVFTITAPEGTMNGTMTFNGSTTARVAVTFDSKNYVFFIDLITFEIRF